MDRVKDLQTWYLSQCDGDWEHQSGVRIETLDNPGWSVNISLVDTDLHGADFKEISDLNSDDTWIRCWVENNEWRGFGGPEMLDAILDNFLTWAQQVSRPSA
jgi:hypothetical protein